MQIEERSLGDVVILDVKGEMTSEERVELLKEKADSLIGQGHKKIVLNLADVPYMDSAGLGVLVRMLTMASRHGGSVKLVNLRERVEKLLTITKLLSIFVLRSASEGESE